MSTITSGLLSLRSSGDNSTNRPPLKYAKPSKEGYGIYVTGSKYLRFVQNALISLELCTKRDTSKSAAILHVFGLKLAENKQKKMHSLKVMQCSMLLHKIARKEKRFHRQRSH